MSVSHILLVCPNDHDPKQIKATGQLAFALSANSIQVSIQTGNEEAGALHKMGSKFHVHHTPPVRMQLPWKTPLATQLRKTIAADETIDLIHFVTITEDFAALEAVCHDMNVPTTAQTEDPEAFNIKNIPLWQRQKYMTALDRLNRIIVPNNNILEQANNLHLDNLTLVPLGVQMDRFKPVLSKRPTRRELGLPESATLVCCMADFEPNNRQLDTLRLCMPLGDLLYILFIGRPKDPMYVERVRAEAQKLGVEPFVLIRDAVDNPEDYLKASDVFMLLGGVEERQQTILEAQSCGLPVVITPAPSALNLTSGNKTGVVIYPNNTLAKQAVHKLLTDPNFRQGRSVHARPFVKKEHGFREMIAAYERVFQNI